MTRRDGGVDDILAVIVRIGGHGEDGGGGQGQKGSADHWCHSRLISAVIGEGDTRGPPPRITLTNA